MRSLVFFLALVALLVVALLVIGWFLPQTREGRAETVIAAAPEQVMAVIADVERQPEWRRLGRVTRTATGWSEVTARGEVIDFVAEDMTRERIVLRFSSDAGYTGEWSAWLEPVPRGTRIAVVERATIPSPIRRIVARVLFNPTAFANDYLAALKARVEGF